MTLRVIHKEGTAYIGDVGVKSYLTSFFINRVLLGRDLRSYVTCQLDQRSYSPLHIREKTLFSKNIEIV
jgi:hypothetical protein